MSSSRPIFTLPNTSYNIAGLKENDPSDWDAISIFRNKYKIPYVKHDESKWDEGWEKVLSTLSASKDVFPVFSTHWLGDKSRGYLGAFHGTEDELHKRVRTLRDLVIPIEEFLNAPSTFLTAWPLMGDAERKRHLLTGIKETCGYASTHSDGRALCPEVTTTGLAERKGRAFVEFARWFVSGTKAASAEDGYLPRSEWWSAAVTTPEPWPEEMSFAFTQLSWQRNEFIGTFLVLTMLSVRQSISKGTPRPNKQKGIVKANGDLVLTWAKTVSIKRDKPLIRCEGCAKTPEEVGENARFMICSNCRSKLDFVVYYCSQACQKDDWRVHKKHCGKKKMAKKLPGTIHDPFWAYPSISDALHVLRTTDSEKTPDDDSDDSDTPTTKLGFRTPHPSRPYSNALQNQIALLESERDTDYYLYDTSDSDHPIRIIFDGAVKTCFRMIREEAMFGAGQAGVEALAEHLIVAVGHQAPFSKEGILAQFEREYGGDMKARMERFEVEAVERGFEYGVTFVEMMCLNMTVLVGRESS